MEGLNLFSGEETYYSAVLRSIGEAIRSNRIELALMRTNLLCRTGYPFMGAVLGASVCNLLGLYRDAYDLLREVSIGITNKRVTGEYNIKLYSIIVNQCAESGDYTADQIATLLVPVETGEDDLSDFMENEL